MPSTSTGTPDTTTADLARDRLDAAVVQYERGDGQQRAGGELDGQHRDRDASGPPQAVRHDVVHLLGQVRRLAHEARTGDEPEQHQGGEHRARDRHAARPERGQHGQQTAHGGERGGLHAQRLPEPSRAVDLQLGGGIGQSRAGPPRQQRDEPEQAERQEVRVQPVDGDPTVQAGEEGQHPRAHGRAGAPRLARCREPQHRHGNHAGDRGNEGGAGTGPQRGQPQRAAGGGRDHAGPLARVPRGVLNGRHRSRLAKQGPDPAQTRRTRPR